MIKKLCIIALLLLNTTTIKAATFSLDTLNSFSQNQCTYKLDVYIDPENKISNAADLILQYNSNEVSIIDVDKNIEGIQVFPGKAYESYVYNKVNEVKSEIVLTGVSFKGVREKTLFASVLFVARVKDPKFNIYFDAVGNTLDSNIAETTTSLDLLTSTYNNSFSVTDYNCRLSEEELNSILVNNEIKEDKSIASYLWIALFLLLGGAILVLFILLNLLKVRIRIVDNHNIAVQGAVLTTYKNKEIDSIYVSNKKGAIWLRRREYKHFMTVSKPEYLLHKYPNGLSSNVITLKKDN